MKIKPEESRKGSSRMELYYRQRRVRREFAVIAVMCALAILSRSIFYMLPQIKPMAAIVLLTGALCGKRAGIITGAVSLLLSNFLFGQGPWTVAQMIGFAMLGFLAGIAKNWCDLSKSKDAILFSVIGGILVFSVYGVIVDTATVVVYMRPFSWSTAMPVYLAGVPFNLMHGGATVFFLAVMTRPIARKMQRVVAKYHVFEK